ncbi:DNA translocase FtsK [Pectobacterium versatile]|uniref:DNA translocase FtsK n=1 Tax=Pectobacterium versatile TaxID=2488639 RepID=UPI0030169807
MQNNATALLFPLDNLPVPPEEICESNDLKATQMAEIIESCLASYHIDVTISAISQGPVFTLFELCLSPGVKVGQIVALEYDLSRALSAEKLRVLRTIPGKPCVGIEIQNKYRRMVSLRELLGSKVFQETSSPLAIMLGKHITGQPIIADLANIHHLLIAGMTGAGKSVCLDGIILSMLSRATPEMVRFIMIDPKILDLSLYQRIPHLLTDVVTDIDNALDVLDRCSLEVDRRYKRMSALGVRNIIGYNERIEQEKMKGRPIPDPFWRPDSGITTQPILEQECYIVVIIDDAAELLKEGGERVKNQILELVKNAHFVGIHLILTATLPSTSSITGAIKNSIPACIALSVRSRGDSKVILGQDGAELLLGEGDMLYKAPNSTEPLRIHSAFTSEQDIRAMVKFWNTYEQPQYNNIFNQIAQVDEGLDPLFEQAVEFVIEQRRASVAGVQRQFRIGYNRAAKMIEKMEMQGIISYPNHSGNREVLVPPSYS